MNVAQLITTDYRRALIGVGVTGLSVARHLRKLNKEFVVFDTRSNPSSLPAFKAEFPEVDIQLGEIHSDQIASFREVILSPGIDPDQPWLQKAQALGVEVVGDIELFARVVDAPVVAITGSNAKSTVTTLLGEMAKAAGVKVGVGGNLGTAALDLLDEEADLYILELSSFQLELIESLKPSVACILNMSADHMDRYGSMINYHQAKQRIYKNAVHLVFNRDDQLTQPLLQQGQTGANFGSGIPDLKQYGLIKDSADTYLVKGTDKLLSASEAGLKGAHNLTNILAAMAMGEALGLALEAMQQASRSFKGLPHRSQTVAEIGGVVWIDDSKATNVGAVKAALSGLGEDKNIVLIAGGQAKGQSFAELQSLVKKHVRQLVLIGEDADQFARDMGDAAPCVFAVNMESAVQVAAKAAAKGEIVLLSPACASFDMFSGYQQRGQIFSEAVGALK